MRIVYYPTGREPLIARLIRFSFPDYDGRTLEVHVSDAQIDVASYWNEGTRSEYVFVDLDTWERRVVGETPKSGQRTALPPRIVCVEHRWIKGRDHGLRFHVRPTDCTKDMKPEPVKGLRPDDHIVLRYTAKYKASYGGIVHYRLYRAEADTGITAKRWTAARKRLVKRGLLMRNGAIMPAGRNVLVRQKECED